MGPQLRRTPIISPLARMPASSCRVYFDNDPYQIHRLGFEACSPKFKPEAVPVIPRHNHSAFQPAEDYFYTTATLDNAIAVTACRSSIAGYSVITGLIFHLSDGTEASVGQVRLDCLEARADLGPYNGLYVIFQFFPQKSLFAGHSYIHSIAFAESKSTKSRSFRLSFTGSLEWWFSHRRCILVQDNRQSPNGIYQDDNTHEYIPGT